MKIDAIADLHGHKPELPGGDLLIVAGDCTQGNYSTQWIDFYNWLAKSPYLYKIIVGGNHDRRFINYRPGDGEIDLNTIYLENSQAYIEPLRIWGSPMTPRFDGQNPKAMAFTDSRENMAKYWTAIPEGLDILVTHGPPHGILDLTSTCDMIGDKALWHEVWNKRPRIHIFGHNHQQGGVHASRKIKGHQTTFYNVSCVNEHYELVRGATRIEL